jgi:hypothetical protein
MRAARIDRRESAGRRGMRRYLEIVSFKAAPCVGSAAAAVHANSFMIRIWTRFAVVRRRVLQLSP